MFLHLGGEVVVHTNDIIAIFDMQSTLKSKISKEFLKSFEDEGNIRIISNEEPRAFVITREAKKDKKENRRRKSIIYYSPISALTLQKRAGFMDDIEKYWLCLLDNRYYFLKYLFLAVYLCNISY